MWVNAFSFLISCKEPYYVLSITAAAGMILLAGGGRGGEVWVDVVWVIALDDVVSDVTGETVVKGELISFVKNQKRI